MKSELLVYKVKVHSKSCRNDFVFGEKEEVIEYLKEFNLNDQVSFQPGLETGGTKWTPIFTGYHVPISRGIELVDETLTRDNFLNKRD